MPDYRPGLLATALVPCLWTVVAGPRAEIDLEIRYPPRLAVVSPDSNFLFGSVGSGEATLEIDGNAIPVEPNGAFLAWLPVPEASRGDTAFYRFRVVEGADTVTAAFPIRRPPSGPPPGAASPWTSTYEHERWYRPGDVLRVSIAGEAGAAVDLVAGAERFPLDDTGVLRGSLNRYAGRVDLDRLHRAACAAGDCRTGVDELGREGGSRLAVPLDTVTAWLVARTDGGVTRSPATLRLARFPDPAPRVRLIEAADVVNGQSGVVVGRPTASGPYRWRFPEGTVATVAAVEGDRVGLALGSDLVGWVLAEDVEPARGDPGTEPGRIFDGRATVDGRVVDFRIGVTRPVPAHVTVTGSRSIRLTLYDAHADIGRLSHGSGTGVVRMDWTQAPGPVVHIDIELEWAIWGTRLTVEQGDARAYEGPERSTPLAAGDAADGAVLRLALRRAPDIDRLSPLRGIRVAVDPGHPGAGSYGPTGLFEGDANLAVARALAALLREAGAEPIMIRDDRSAMGLYERTGRARAADADLLVSIHNNALPDGVRPFERAGTSTFYYHPQSAALARSVQTGMVERIRLADRGVLWGDLAMVREPWMPAILTEGAFMMIPAQEAALRTEEFQTRYARGVLDGIERFLREYGARP